MFGRVALESVEQPVGDDGRRAPGPAILGRDRWRRIDAEQEAQDHRAANTQGLLLDVFRVLPDIEVVSIVIDRAMTLDRILAKITPRRDRLRFIEAAADRECLPAGDMLPYPDHSVSNKEVCLKGVLSAVERDLDARFQRHDSPT